MTLTRSTGQAILTVEEVGQLLVEPTLMLACATDVATVIQTEQASFRLPIVQADPQAGWVAEGAEIPVTDAVLAEDEITFAKLAGLSIITSELAADSSPEASEAVGQGLARDMSRRLDAAFFGNVASPAPTGLGGLTGTTTIAAGSVVNLDPFLEAISAAEILGAQLTSFVANPTDALALAKLKQYGTAQANMSLLQPDPSQPGVRVISGIPLRVSAGVAPGTIWGIPGDRAHIIVRSDASVTADSSVFFTSDRVAVRGTMRCGFSFPHPQAIMQITLTEGD